MAGQPKTRWARYFAWSTRDTVAAHAAWSLNLYGGCALATILLVLFAGGGISMIPWVFVWFGALALVTVAGLAWQGWRRGRS